MIGRRERTMSDHMTKKKIGGRIWESRRPKQQEPGKGT